jgi:hypothetical protein
MTGIRSWIGLSTLFADVTMMVQDSSDEHTESEARCEKPRLAGGPDVLSEAARKRGWRQNVRQLNRRIPVWKSWPATRKTIGRYQATAFLEGATVGGLCGDRLGARINHAIPRFCVLGPEGNQTPSCMNQGSFAIHPANRDGLTRGDVITRHGSHQRDRIEHASIIKGFTASGDASAHECKDISP